MAALLIFIMFVVTADRVITFNLSLIHVFEQRCNQKVRNVSCDIHSVSKLVSQYENSNFIVTSLMRSIQCAYAVCRHCRLLKLKKKIIQKTSLQSTQRSKTAKIVN